MMVSYFNVNPNASHINPSYIGWWCGYMLENKTSAPAQGIGFGIEI